MCNFLSAIVTKNGKFICHPELTDSHESLIEAYGLKDEENFRERQFVRIEFTPPDDFGQIGCNFPHLPLHLLLLFLEITR